MKILVTGSNGLIGKEIVRLLRERKIEVVEFSASKGLDILNPEQIEKSMKGCQAAVHAAAVLEENHATQQLWKVNVDGTKNVLEAAVKNRIGRLVFLSSVGVYGNSGGTKNEETPFNPETPYEKTKAEGEKMVEQYQELVPFTTVRPAIVTGPNKYWKQIFHVVKQNLPLIGKGTNHWQTVHYKDVASAVVFLLFLDAAENEAFVVAGNDKPTLKELIETMRAQLGLPNPAPTMPEWIGKILARAWGIWMALQGKPNILSATNIKRMLRERSYDLTKINAYGWKAKYPYKEALKETLNELVERGEIKTG